MAGAEPCPGSPAGIARSTMRSTSSSAARRNWKPPIAVPAGSTFSTSAGALARSITTAPSACTFPQKDTRRAASSIFWIFSRSSDL